MSTSDLAISIREVSKSYSIAHRDMSPGLPGLGSRIRRAFTPQVQRETFWALQDVSLDIDKGDVVGIIGRNGAGKSTLLKILSRITEPTSGVIDLYGRVASLLEVGTGFHPELTGRENVYLNGAILGMNRVEINERFDAIVDFSGVEKFLDTPVKRYSSGMYVRLAFAVAAHMDPDILVVDEVLAVGDQAFQKKCLGKMQDVADAGRTVILVSHNMTTVTRLCSKAVLLENGKLTAVGRADAIATQYMSGKSGSHAHEEWTDLEKAPGSEVVRINSIKAINSNGDICDSFSVTHSVRVEMEYTVLEGGHVLTPNFHVINDEGVCLFCTRDNEESWRGRPKQPGKYKSTAIIPGNTLAEGGHLILSAMSTYIPHRNHWVIPEAIGFQVLDELESTGVRGDYGGQWPGVVRPWFDWETERLDVNDEVRLAQRAAV